VMFWPSMTLSQFGPWSFQILHSSLWYFNFKS
jgi:hypothetical protein